MVEEGEVGEPMVFRYIVIQIIYVIKYYNIIKRLFIQVKDKVHRCTGTEALYRPYGP